MPLLLVLNDIERIKQIEYHQCVWMRNVPCRLNEVLPLGRQMPPDDVLGGRDSQGSGDGVCSEGGFEHSQSTMNPGVSQVLRVLSEVYACCPLDQPLVRPHQRIDVHVLAVHSSLIQYLENRIRFHLCSSEQKESNVIKLGEKIYLHS